MARAYDGTGDYLSTPAMPDLDNFTISIMCRTTTTAGGDGAENVFGAIEAGTSEIIQAHFNTQWNGSGSLDYTQFSVRISGSSSSVGHFINATVYDGNWHHLIFRRNVGVIDCFVDGAIQTLVFGSSVLGSETMQFVQPMVYAARNVRGSIGGYSDCDLAELAWYGEALNQASINELADRNTPDSVRASQLLRYYPQVRENHDVVGGTIATVNGDDTIIPHPRMRRPFNQALQFAPIPAAPSDQMMLVA